MSNCVGRATIGMEARTHAAHAVCECRGCKVGSGLSSWCGCQPENAHAQTPKPTPSQVVYPSAESKPTQYVWAPKIEQPSPNPGTAIVDTQNLKEKAGAHPLVQLFLLDVDGVDSLLLHGMHTMVQLVCTGHTASQSESVQHNTMMVLCQFTRPCTSMWSPPIA